MSSIFRKSNPDPEKDLMEALTLLAVTARRMPDRDATKINVCDGETFMIVWTTNSVMIDVLRGIFNSDVDKAFREFLDEGRLTTDGL